MVIERSGGVPWILYSSSSADDFNDKQYKLVSQTNKIILMHNIMVLYALSIINKNLIWV